MEINDVEKDFESELLEITEPGKDAEEQRDRNTHHLLMAWKDLLEARKKEKTKATPRATSARI